MKIKDDLLGDMATPVDITISLIFPLETKLATTIVNCSDNTLLRSERNETNSRQTSK